MGVNLRALLKCTILMLVCLGLVAINATAVTPAATPPDLSRLQFLVGHWTIAGGRMTMFGARPRGESEITSEVNGYALFVRDTFTLVGVEGQDLGKNGSVMLIYRDGDALRAVFSNGRGALHYKGLIAADGKSVVFESAPPQGASTFRATYKEQGQDTLTWTLETKSPDGSDFRLEQTETLVRRK